MEQITNYNVFALQYVGTNYFARVHWGNSVKQTVLVTKATIDKAEMFKTLESAEEVIKMLKLDSLEAVPIRVSYSRVK